VISISPLFGDEQTQIYFCIGKDNHLRELFEHVKKITTYSR
jgi:hypothetical protein